MSKIKLWVDDIRNPKSFGKADWHWAKTVTEAIRVLDTMEVIEVSLDHDISHSIGVDEIVRPFPCGETFEPVARFLELLINSAGDIMFAYNFPNKFPVTLHTANPQGAEKMKNILGTRRFNVVVDMAMPCNRFEEEI